MFRLGHLFLTLFISLSTFFFTESQNDYAEKAPKTQHKVLKSTALNNQGIIVNSYLDFTVNSFHEEQISFFKKLHLKNRVCKEQQENYLVYQKTCKLISISLPIRQIIFPHHSFT
ncbi:MAG: hypothetical protein ABJM36_06480 [Algibacter sp.]|uniref:hypothetical protein n=1 Tax=Algibacter sp. TaxID=1872428 RepID=UPI003296EDF3